MITSGPRRRWSQLSLRTVLLIVALVSVPLAWFGSRLREARNEVRGIEALRAADGTFYYDYEYDPTKDALVNPDGDPNWLPVSNRPPPGPHWLNRLFGRNVFAHVDYVAFEGDADAVWKNLHSFGHLRALEVTDGPIASTQLRHVGALSTLRVLLLPRTQIADAALIHLQSLTQLEVLDLSGTKVTGRGLGYLSELRGLHVLALSDTLVDDDGMKSIAALPQLERLYLRRTRVGDGGLRHLARMRCLRLLDLRSTQVTDNGLEYLQSLKELEQLCLGDTHITARGLPHLAVMRGLKGVLLDRERIKDVQLLHDALPQLEISWQ